MAAEFQVEQIDHVELFVPDRQVAAKWYRDVLGLEIISEFQNWADDPEGPLMIGTRTAGTKLALFVGDTVGSRAGTGFLRVAFRVGSESFVSFVFRLPSLNLIDQQGRQVTAGSVSDHDQAFSIYFCDPYGHFLEITTYDYQKTQLGLGRVRDSQ